MNRQFGGIEFTLIAIVAATAAIGLAAARLAYVSKQAGIEQCQKEVAAKQAELADLGEKLQKEGENHIIDMQAAYDAGEYNARQNALRTAQKGATDVERYPVFKNMVCTLPDESLSTVNMQRRSLFGLRPDSGGTGAGVRAPAASAGTPAAVSIPGSSQGRQDGDAVSGHDQHHRPLGAVPEAAQPASPTRKVP